MERLSQSLSWLNFFLITQFKHYLLCNTFPHLTELKPPHLLLCQSIPHSAASQVALLVKKKKKNLPANTGKTPWGGHGNSLQYSCLENPMNRVAWWTMIHRVAKSQTQLKLHSTHVHTSLYYCTYHFVFQSFVYILEPLKRLEVACDENHIKSLSKCLVNEIMMLK